MAFDERGTGFGRGEGCGILILKPLDQAMADKDPIRAVIRGTGINQDGKTAGITMPNGDAQGDLLTIPHAKEGEAKQGPCERLTPFSLHREAYKTSVRKCWS